MTRWTQKDIDNLQSASRRQEGDKVKQRKPRTRKEESLQIQIAEYMRIKHPDVIFRSDFAAGCKMTMGQAVRHQKMQHSKNYPDFFIAKPNKTHAGLFLELKRSWDEVYTKDGKIRGNEHIQGQKIMLERLRSEGYAAYFGCGFDHSVKIIENYLDDWTMDLNF